VNILAVSGSLRLASSSTNVLRALRIVAPAEIEVVLHPPLDSLPFFNPDIEEAGPPPAIEAWRSRIRLSDALVISSPEYAHGVSGVLKNALDWLVGGVEIVGKPIAVINARPQATIAHAALVETLRVMGGRIVEQASLPLTGRKLDAPGIASDPDLSARLRSVLSALARSAAELSADRASPA
jgi:chromate reductase